MGNHGEAQIVECDIAEVTLLDVVNKGSLALSMGRRGGQIAGDTGAYIVAIACLEVVTADLPGS
jgi:hypothetical protein